MADALSFDAWTLQPVCRADGMVDLDLALIRGGETTRLLLTLTREQSRDHARAVLAAGGDATERTMGRPVTAVALAAIPPTPTFRRPHDPEEPEPAPVEPRGPDTDGGGAVALVDRRAEARLKGYVGEACPDCANFTLVRNGTCLKCDTCGSTTGCS